MSLSPCYGATPLYALCLVQKDWQSSIMAYIITRLAKISGKPRVAPPGSDTVPIPGSFSAMVNYDYVWCLRY